MALVDLSNTLPLTDPFGALADLGRIDLVALHDDQLAEGAAAAAGQHTVLAPDIPYRQAGWLTATGGVHGATLAADVAAVAAQQPWALVVHRSGAPTILIRETSGGLHIRVDQFVHRVDTPGTVQTTAWVTKYGAPLPGAAVTLAWIGRIQGTGGGPDGDPQAPRAPLPDINVPSDVLRFAGSTRTGADGRAPLQIDVAAVGDVRGYLDGQIYALGYGLQDAPDVVQHQFDLVILHARSAYAPPALPSWTRDAQPVFAQFGNLYPVMSRRLIDLNKYEDVVQSRAVLALSLALPLEDPNHMPVTRDLSESKRQMLLAWLNERDANGFVLRRDPPAAGPGLPVAAAPTEGLESAHPADARPADEAFTRTLIALQLRKGRGDSEPDR